MERTTTAKDNAPTVDAILLTREDMELLAPWLTETLTAQDRQDANAEPCQVLAALLNLSHRLYGMPASSRATCICNG